MWEGQFLSVTLLVGKGKKHHDHYRGSQLTCFWVLVPSSTQQLTGHLASKFLKRVVGPQVKHLLLNDFEREFQRLIEYLQSFRFARRKTFCASMEWCLQSCEWTEFDGATRLGGLRWRIPGYMYLAIIIKIKGCNYTQTCSQVLKIDCCLKGYILDVQAYILFPFIFVVLCTHLYLHVWLCVHVSVYTGVCASRCHRLMLEVFLALTTLFQSVWSRVSGFIDLSRPTSWWALCISQILIAGVRDMCSSALLCMNNVDPNSAIHDCAEHTAHWALSPAPFVRDHHVDFWIHSLPPLCKGNAILRHTHTIILLVLTLHILYI